MRRIPTWTAPVAFALTLLLPAFAYAQEQPGSTVVVVGGPQAAPPPPPVAAVGASNVQTIVVPQGCAAHITGGSTVIVCGNAAAPSASAAPPAPVAPTAPVSTDGHAGMVQIERSYAGHTALGLLVGGVIGSAVVHGSHGNYDKALGAIGLHIGLPVVGALLGSAADRRGTGIVYGVLLGFTASTVIDLWLLSREKVWVMQDSEEARSAGLGRASPARPQVAKARVLPAFSPVEGGALVGATGRF